MRLTRIILMNLHRFAGPSAARRMLAPPFMLLAPALLLAATVSALAEPVLPGYERLTRGDHLDSAARGEILLGELNCLSCHDAGDAIHRRITTRRAPDLTDAGARLTTQYLRRFIHDPHGINPGTKMPDLLRATESGSDDHHRAVDALTHFLASQGGPLPQPTLSATPDEVSRGRELYHTVGCVACHQPEGAESTTIPSVPLPEMARKTTLGSLIDFLRNPTHARPAGRMPDLHLTSRQARSIAVYLLRDQLEHAMDREPTRQPGLRYEYYRQDAFSAMPDFDSLNPDASGYTKTIGLDAGDFPTDDVSFALRFTGVLRIDTPGDYTFYTTSDDGSRLYVNDELLIDNGGVHAPTEVSGTVHLTEGDHALTVAYFERAGGEMLEVEWDGPGFDRQPIPGDITSSYQPAPMVPLDYEPMEVDPALAERGREIFQQVGCASCHEIDGIAPQPSRQAPPLDALAGKDGACLSDDPPHAVPDFDLSDDQQSALRTVLNNLSSLRQPRSANRQVVHTLATFNCYACHERDGIGGPTDDRRQFFRLASELDFGEAGRIPPRLTGAGAKLKPEAIRRIIHESELHVRSRYMATHMPTFPEQPMTGFAESLDAADRISSEKDDPPFSEEAVDAGRKLVGIQGAGCVNCHNVAGYRSVGIPGIDLETAHERLNPGWLRRFLRDPQQYVPEVRMPAFWQEEGAIRPDLLDGEAARQIDAVITYLNLGPSMPLPAGLEQGGDELTPVDHPIIFRTFMEDVGQRAITVGFPERVHVAFSAGQVRLAKAWRGKFFDASGTWQGRGGGFSGPLGSSVIDMPPGPAFATLASRSAPWPQTTPGMQHGGQRDFLGYRLDDESRPVFRYKLAGVTISEQPAPLLQPGGAGLVRRFNLEADDNPPSNLHFMIAAGQEIEELSANRWRIDGQRTLTLSGHTAEPIRRQSQQRTELLLPVTFDEDAAASFELELSW